MASLAEGVHALVQHMRNEQQLMRDWVDVQSRREADMRKLIERLEDRLEAR
jgi:hypothetical protein